MAGSHQQSAYAGMNLPSPLPWASSGEGNAGYMIDRQNVVGSSGPHAIQRQQGGSSSPQNDPGWIERVLEEMKDMLVLLNAQGRIIYASPSSMQITGRTAEQLEGSHLSQYIHESDKAIFLRDMDDAVATDRPFRAHVRFQKTTDTYCLMEIHGHPHIASQNESQARHTSTEERCTGFFLMCRPYPTKNSQLLDSFLEHKLENIRLVQQIAKLKQEEEEEANMSRLSYPNVEQHKPLVENSTTAQIIQSEQDSSETAAANSNSDDSDDESGDSFADNPPQNEGISHIEGIEVMTGLYYGDGERSQGLSTGLRKGRLVHCDIDITTAADQARNAQEGDRRKRLKGGRMCDDCGTDDSPEWRKGPNGPKTLCNACGCEFLSLFVEAWS